MSYSTDNLIPVEINDYNANATPRLLSFDFTSETVVLQDPSDYEVTIEKMKLPLYNIPINNNANWRVYFESLDKTTGPSNIPPGGFIQDIFSEEVYSITQFCELFNKFLNKNLGEYTYGSLSYSTESKLLTWSEGERVGKKAYVRIWVEQRLGSLLSGLPLLQKEIFDGEPFLSLEGSKPDTVADYRQSHSTARHFYSIASLRCRSTLPTAKYYLANNEKKTIEPSDVLTSIDFIDAEMIDNDVIYYHPSTFRHYTLLPSRPVTSFRLVFTVYYCNGVEKDIYLHQNEHASISLKFVKL